MRFNTTSDRLYSAVCLHTWRVQDLQSKSIPCDCVKISHTAHVEVPKYTDIFTKWKQSGNKVETKM